MNFKNVKKIGEAVTFIGAIIGTGIKLIATILEIKSNGENPSVENVVGNLLKDVTEEE